MSYYSVTVNVINIRKNKLIFCQVCCSKNVPFTVTKSFLGLANLSCDYQTIINCDYDSVTPLNMEKDQSVLSTHSGHSPASDP